MRNILRTINLLYFLDKQPINLLSAKTGTLQSLVLEDWIRYNYRKQSQRIIIAKCYWIKPLNYRHVSTFLCYFLHCRSFLILFDVHLLQGCSLLILSIKWVSVYFTKKWRLQRYNNIFFSFLYLFNKGLKHVKGILLHGPPGRNH